MTSTIKVNNIKDTGDNNMVVKCGSTLTLGKSGDTVAIAAGATQSGFGKTGAVNFITTPKTGDFTAAAGEGYFINTGGGTVTVTLPGSPSAGNMIAISDYNSTAGTNAITIARNGSNINGAASNLLIQKSNSAVQLVYVDSTTGWQNVTTANPSDIQETFIAATGGTITTSGNCKVHTFTGPGTFCVSQISGNDNNNEVSYIVVAGGGGGGSRDGGGGGGAGGFRESKSPVTPYTASPLDGRPSAPNRITVTATAFPITVGGGGNGGNGAPSSPRTTGNVGSPSSFSSITSAGGGLGTIGANPGGLAQNGGNGGSGGGGGGRACGGTTPSGGTGNTPPVSPAQGTNGGAGRTTASPPSLDNGGGGGGATVAGGAAGGGNPGNTSGGGGTGATTSISGSPLSYAGGGGGGTETGTGAASPCGTGGKGAQSDDSPSGNAEADAGTTNRGGGGGGGAGGSGPANSMNGANGGSGVVIIRYKFQ
jgi:hypothetical protein